MWEEDRKWRWKNGDMVRGDKWSNGLQLASLSHFSSPGSWWESGIEGTYAEIKRPA